MPPGENVHDNTWPMPKFRFEVDLSKSLKDIAFQEVSGLDTETQVIEYRKSKNPLFLAEKMPGIARHGNVTLKRGVFTNDKSFWDWHSQVKMNTIKREIVIIKLLDEGGHISMQWKLEQAWPTKITSTDLAADGNEVAIDTLEIAYEKLTIINGQ